MAPEMAAVERTGGYDLKVCYYYILHQVLILQVPLSLQFECRDWTHLFNTRPTVL